MNCPNCNCALRVQEDREDVKNIHAVCLGCHANFHVMLRQISSPIPMRINKVRDIQADKKRKEYEINYANRKKEDAAFKEFVI